MCKPKNIGKYKNLFEESLVGLNRRLRFEPLAFESSGLAHPAVQRLVRSWENAAKSRLKSRTTSRSGFCTRHKLSSTIHYWNAVSIIRRAGSGLRIRKSLSLSGHRGAFMATRVLAIANCNIAI